MFGAASVAAAVQLNVLIERDRGFRDVKEQPDVLRAVGDQVSVLARPFFVRLAVKPETEPASYATAQTKGNPQATAGDAQVRSVRPERASPMLFNSPRPWRGLVEPVADLLEPPRDGHGNTS